MSCFDRENIMQSCTKSRVFSCYFLNDNTKCGLQNLKLCRFATEVKRSIYIIYVVLVKVIQYLLLLYMYHDV